MALIISGSGIRFIVRLATILLTRFLSSYVNLDNARASKKSNRRHKGRITGGQNRQGHSSVYE